MKTLVIVCISVGFTLLHAWNPAIAQGSQEHVHQMSHDVMPFDMTKTLHIFKMTETGGIERVVVRESKDGEQVTLIRQHLKHEADNFIRGDYSDPFKLHGAAMPGLAELQAGASRVKVSYHEIPTGAEIVFATADVSLLTAVHRWFGAQLSEHGADAKAE